MASEAELIFGALGFFVILGTLLGLSGVAGPAIQIPEITTGTDQDDPGAHVDCVYGTQWFCDLGSFTIHVVIGIANILTFAAAWLFFFFQLLTFQLPIPFWLNTIIVVPPAIMAIYIGIRFARGGG